MKKTLFLLITILTISSVSAQTQKAEATPPCNVSSYVYVIVDYNLGFNQEFTYNMSWGSYTDAFRSKKEPTFNCNVGVNKYAQGVIFGYRNYGCATNPGKKAYVVKASCTNCTNIRVIVDKIPKEASLCSYIIRER